MAQPVAAAVRRLPGGRRPRRQDRARAAQRRAGGHPSGRVFRDDRDRRPLPRREQLQLHEDARRVGAPARDPVRLRIVGGDLRGDRGAGVRRARHHDPAAAQHVRLFEAALRPACVDARVPRSDRGVEVLQRVRAEREPQGRHAERGEQVVPADSGNGSRAAVQELSARVRGWRAAAGFSLRQGRGRHDPAPGRGTQRSRPLQHRIRRVAHLARARQRGLQRA